MLLVPERRNVLPEIAKRLVLWPAAINLQHSQKSDNRHNIIADVGAFFS